LATFLQGLTLIRKKTYLLVFIAPPAEGDHCEHNKHCDNNQRRSKKHRFFFHLPVSLNLKIFFAFCATSSGSAFALFLLRDRVSETNSRSAFDVSMAYVSFISISLLVGLQRNSTLDLIYTLLQIEKENKSPLFRFF
jgi:hypothetical protein